MSIKEIAYDIFDHLTEELAEAMKEVEDMKKNPEKYKGYSDVDEMMRDILA